MNQPEERGTEEKTTTDDDDATVDVTSTTSETVDSSDVSEFEAMKKKIDQVRTMMMMSPDEISSS